MLHDIVVAPAVGTYLVAPAAAELPAERSQRSSIFAAVAEKDPGFPQPTTSTTQVPFVSVVILVEIELDDTEFVLTASGACCLTLYNETLPPRRLSMLPA